LRFRDARAPVARGRVHHRGAQCVPAVAFAQPRTGSRRPRALLSVCGSGEDLMAAARRRVLMVTPHFPPDSSAAAHRVRLLAPHLPAAGWTPTIVTVDPSAYEGRLDRDLEALVPESLRIVRAPAWHAHATRRFGLGDLGLRAYAGLRRACRELLEREAFDALFITVYPVYPALLGPMLKRAFDVPFVLDYQDPWVGAWGRTVGGGSNGHPDWKSRASR